jgi:hypothetical protein
VVTLHFSRSRRKQVMSRHGMGTLLFRPPAGRTPGGGRQDVLRLANPTTSSCSTSLPATHRDRDHCKASGELNAPARGSCVRQLRRACANPELRRRFNARGLDGVRFIVDDALASRSWADAHANLPPWQGGAARRCGPQGQPIRRVGPPSQEGFLLCGVVAVTPGGI